MLIFFVMVIDILLVFLSFALGKEVIKNVKLKEQLKGPVISVQNALAKRKQDAIRGSIMELISILLFIIFILYITKSKTVPQLKMEDIIIYASTLILCIVSTGLSTAKRLLFALEPVRITNTELLYQGKLLSLKSLTYEFKNDCFEVYYKNGKTNEKDLLCSIDPKSKNGETAVKLFKNGR